MATEPRPAGSLNLWLPVLAVMGVIFWLSSKPATAYPDIDFPFADKIAHLVLYGSLGLCLARPMGRRLARWLIPMVALMAMAYGITDELHQIPIEGRSFEVGDLLADLIGGALGATAWVVAGRVPPVRPLR